ncbi:MAG TPA: glycosyltransferase family 39 protein, partial [Xanthomonadales bacterium]|nr:glycosyltransferase family 39 protein [Xanthomonadales bacterium]
LVARIAARELGAADGARAGMLALAMPVAGSLGVLALPDVPMTFAALLCIDAAARALRRVDAGVALELALGLAIGALAHYRYAAVVGIGFLVLLALPRGRAALRDPRILAALAVGALAWAPLVAWNVAHANEGLRFQLVERHPWAFHGDAWRFVVVQAVLATPLLFVAALAAGRRFLRAGAPATSRFLAAFGIAFVLAFFVLGFFADRERTSFHWPLPGLLALVALAPAVLATWPRWLATATFALAALGSVAMLVLYGALAFGAWNAFGGKWYPENFVGWHALAREVDATLATMPPDTIVVAGDFKVAATLAFLRGEPGIRVLDHPLNRHHGRAPQLALWGATAESRAGLGAHPVLLLESPSHVRLSELHARMDSLCAWAGALPRPQVLDVDGGRKRFWLFALPAARPAGACVPPAMAYIVSPAPDAEVAGRVVVTGWATKDDVPLVAVDATIDGRRVATASYGRDEPFVAPFLGGASRDPALPNVGFDAEIDVSALAPGRHRLGLVLRDAQGREEPGPQQDIVVVR